LKCEACGRKPATYRYCEMVDGELVTLHLCEDCAREKGVAALAAPLVNILMGLLGGGSVGGREDEETGTVCPRCGLSFAEFRRKGRLGCGACYDSFRDDLKVLLRRIHGSTSHVGRVPRALSDGVEHERELRRLRAELRSAVQREEYERAAELRDLIREKERAGPPEGKHDVDVRRDDE